MFYYYNWEEVDINWEALDMNWEEVGIVRDLLQSISPAIGGGKPKIDLDKINKLDQKKKRAIIHLACKIEGTEYEEYRYINEKDIVITVDHVNIILDKVLNNIKVHVQNIS
jgi:hypothetical protein